MPPSTVQSLQQVRLVALALIAGPTLFLVVVGIMRAVDAEVVTGEPIPLLTWIAAAMPLVTAPPAYIVRNQKWRTIDGPDDPKRLEIYAGGVILFFALLEGSALFNVVAWLVNGDIVSPFAAGVAIILMAANLPSERELEDLTLER